MLYLLFIISFQKLLFIYDLVWGYKDEMIHFLSRSYLTNVYGASSMLGIVPDTGNIEINKVGKRPCVLMEFKFNWE